MSDISFSGVIQRILPKSVSDHSPVLLEGGGFRNGPSPYRFENMWLKEEGFFDLVAELDFSGLPALFWCQS